MPTQPIRSPGTRVVDTRSAAEDAPQRASWDDLPLDLFRRLPLDAPSLAALGQVQPRLRPLAQEPGGRTRAWMQGTMETQDPRELGKAARVLSKSPQMWALEPLRRLALLGGDDINMATGPGQLREHEGLRSLGEWRRGTPSYLSAKTAPEVWALDIAAHATKGLCRLWNQGTEAQRREVEQALQHVAEHANMPEIQRATQKICAAVAAMASPQEALLGDGGCLLSSALEPPGIIPLLRELMQDTDAAVWTKAIGHLFRITKFWDLGPTDFSFAEFTRLNVRCAQAPYDPRGMAPFRFVMMFIGWPGIGQSSPRRDAAARAAVAQLRDAALGEIFDTTQGEVQQTALVQLQDSAAFTPQRCLVAIKNFRFTHPTLPGAMIAMISRVDWQSSQELLSILIKLAIDAPNREARAVALAELGKGQNLPAVPVLCDQLARGGYSFFLSALNQILAAQDSFPAEMMKRACDPRFFGAVREVAQRNDQDEVTLAARELLSRLAQENLTEESVAAPPAQAARTAAAARPGALRSSLAGVMERLGPSSKQLDLP